MSRRVTFLCIAVLTNLSLDRAAGAADTLVVLTDDTWRVTDQSPTAGWNTDTGFDDSDAAGWEYAFDGNLGIWHTSELTATSPGEVWFRKTFTVDGLVTSAFAECFFDDDGEVFINGVRVVNDTGGGSTLFQFALDGGLFHEGMNLIAARAIDRFAPYHDFRLRLDLEVIPAPAGALVLFPAMLIRRRLR
jgi:hypothetical protein